MMTIKTSTFLVKSFTVQTLLQREISRYQIDLTATGTRGLGFNDSHTLKGVPRIENEFVETLSLENLADKAPTRFEDFACHVQRQFHEIHGARLVHGLGSANIGGHIAQYKVGTRVPHGFQQLPEYLIVQEVTLHELDI